MDLATSFFWDFPDISGRFRVIFWKYRLYEWLLFVLPLFIVFAFGEDLCANIQVIVQAHLYEWPVCIALFKPNFGRRLMFVGCKIQKSWMAFLNWPLDPGMLTSLLWRSAKIQLMKSWRILVFLKRNFRLDQRWCKNCTSKTFLFQRYTESMN